MTEQLEPPLYKYVRLSSDKDIQHAEDLLLRNLIYYAQMRSFNDPFEGGVNFVFEAKEEEKLAHVAEVIKRREHISHEEAIAKAPEWIKANEKDAPRRVRNWIMDDLGVCCLCGSNSSILMWSHYTDGHKGLCVEFAATEIHHVDFFGVVQQVRYTDHIPCVNIYKTPRIELAKAAMLTKARHWQYEQERRAIINDVSEDRPRLRELPKGVLRGVFMGHRIAQDNRERVLRWATQCGVPFAVHQAHLKHDEYGVRFEKVPSPEPR